jgi:electron transfer flavoprotein alpha subunit
LAGHATLAEDLADVLGAAVGATRALVDEGVYPQSLQIGQTGATVSPDVYIALGIAGAVQHMSGAMGASHIVAINNDPEAPIHALADLSVVGDATVVVPRLVEALRSRPSPDGTALP